MPVIAGLEPAAAADALRSAGVRLIAAVPRAGMDPDEVNWRGGVAILLGGEGPGLRAPLLAASDARVSIPMAPPVESLNVAAAAAVLLYAARRQRHGCRRALTVTGP
jgi:tRNA G18 (ribose-2'-O)-methylase SpoU